MTDQEARAFSKYLERRFIGHQITAIKLLPLRVGETWLLHVVRLEIEGEAVLPGQIPDFKGMEAKL